MTTIDWMPARAAYAAAAADAGPAAADASVALRLVSIGVPT